MVSELPVRQLRASLGEHEPPGSTTNSSATDVSTDGHVTEERKREKYMAHKRWTNLSSTQHNLPEEQPSRDQTFISLTRRLGHDVQIRWVEAESGSWQTVSDLIEDREIERPGVIEERLLRNEVSSLVVPLITYQVDPQQLNRDESFRQTQGSGQEDGHDLTNVGRDQVADELLHVVVNGTTFLNSGNNGGEVIISQHHLGGGLGDGGTGTHGNTDFGLLQGRGVVDTITRHCGDFVHALQVLNDLGLVGRLDTREQAGTGASITLGLDGQIVELATGVRLAGGVLFLGEHTDTAADGFGGGLVVTSDDDDADTGGAALHDRVQDFLTRRVQHTDDTDEGQVNLIGVELGRVVQVHVVRLHRVVAGGQGQTTEGVAAGTVLAGQVQDAALQRGGQRHLGRADTGMRTTLQNTLRGALTEQLRSGAQLGGLQRDAVARHGLTIAGELQGELLLPLGLNLLADADGGRAAVQPLLGHVERVQLLGEDDQGGLGGFTDLLEDLLHFVEIDGGVVTHDADRSQLVQDFVVGGLDTLSVEGDLADRLVGGSGDLELGEAAVAALNLVEDEHTRDGHLVGGQRTGLIRADDRGTAEGFDGRQRAHDGVLLGHTARTESQTGGDDSRQTLRDGSDGQRDGDLEVVDGTLDPRATVGGIVEVSDVDGPDGDANQRDDLGQLLTELVQLLLQRRLDLLRLRHFRADLTDGSVQTGADDDTAGLTGRNVGTGEQDVLLVLVDGARVRDGVGVLDHRNRLTGQDGLINADGGGVDLDQADIGRDLVTDGHLHDVTRDDLLGADLLHTGLVAADNLAHLGLVLLQRFNGGLGIALLPHTDDGVGDQDQQNDERFNESFRTFMFLK
uniref:Uncharacterized protein n=1 Tax=Anopheles atroparvus TaxID=41427 RepID=A0AAG5DA10_ANOAO